MADPIPGYKFCPKCNGTGHIHLPPTPESANPMITCPDCAGKGQIMINPPNAGKDK
jgi:DnaJ-class molecular chaperone